MDVKLHRKLDDRREKGTLRSLSSFEGYIDFFSNDYLGLSGVRMKVPESIFGGTGSRLISGTTDSVLEAEKQIAAFFKAEACLMFNSGYDANLGLFSAVPQRGDTILYDELIHASVRDGIRLSLANGISFKHNDTSDLKQKISNARGVVYIAVEALYSMDGDKAPLGEIVEVSKASGAYLIVDEAHSGGVFGKEGRGLADAPGIKDGVFARLITMGKAYGSHGGCVLCSVQLKDYLVNFARSFIYTTALPPSVYQRNALLVADEENENRRKQLKNIISYFRSRYNGKGLISDADSPIQIIQTGSVERTKAIAERLVQDKIAVKPIYAPTVPEGKERIRLCLHAFNTEEEVDRLINVINE